MAKDLLQFFDKCIVSLLRLLISRGNEPLAPGVFRINALHLFRNLVWIATAFYQLVPAFKPGLPLML